MTPMRITEHRGDVAGVPTAWRAGAPADGGAPPPILYVHGVPSASWDWIPFLEQAGGYAPDLPGFGASTRDFAPSIETYDAFLEHFTQTVGIQDRLTVVVHDWGSVGLVFAQRFPERIERLVLLSCLPLVPGYRWHWIARLWRTPVVGELFNLGARRAAISQLLRLARADRGKMPDEWLDHLSADLDAGMRRSILRLYRSAPEARLVEAGRHLHRLRCPALVLWPDRDPYIPARMGAAFADALGGDVTLEMVEDAGHWYWYEHPEVVDRVAEYVRAG